MPQADAGIFNLQAFERLILRDVIVLQLRQSIIERKVISSYEETSAGICEDDGAVYAGFDLRDGFARFEWHFEMNWTGEFEWTVSLFEVRILVSRRIAPEQHFVLRSEQNVVVPSTCHLLYCFVVVKWHFDLGVPVEEVIKFVAQSALSIIIEACCVNVLIVCNVDRVVQAACEMSQ